MAALCTLAWAAPLGAQSVITGVIRDAATREAVSEADVIVAPLQLRVRTDAQGRYTLRRVPAGEHPVVVRRLGFDSVVVVLSVSGADTLVRDFALVPNAQRLAEVAVRGANTAPVPAKLRAFEERRRLGIGRFLTAADIAKDHMGRTSDILRRVPGNFIVRDRFSQAACVGIARGQQSIVGNPGGQPICGQTLARRGLCPMAVYVDGLLVYAGHDPVMFDINSIQPSAIDGIEVYAGAAQLPTSLNGTRGTCGALLIWLK